MSFPKKAWYSDCNDILVVADNRRRAAKLFGSPNLDSFDQEFRAMPEGNEHHFAEGLYSKFEEDEQWHEVITPSSLAVTEGLQRIADCIDRHGIRIAIEFDPKKPLTKAEKAMLDPHLQTMFDFIVAGDKNHLQTTWQPWSDEGGRS